MQNLVNTNNSFKDSEEDIILRQEIQLLKEKLFILTDKLEHLKINLVTVKQGYNIRIGRLYLNIDELDLEILRFKNIESLLNKNLNFEQAEKVIDESLKDRQDTIKEEYAKIDEEEDIVEKRKNVSEKDNVELKKLWRELAHKYHPDLAINEEDRKKREKIMKEINAAYSEGSLETLEALKQEYYEDIEIVSTEFLKNKLEDLKRAIDRTEKEYALLQKSEWYVWKTKMEDANSKGQDIFFELEQKLLEDITAKKIIIKEYQKIHGQQ